MLTTSGTDILSLKLVKKVCILIWIIGQFEFFNRFVVNNYRLMFEIVMVIYEISLNIITIYKYILILL